MTAAVAPAAEQDSPTRPVTMVVPFAPGGVYDTLGRVYAAALSQNLGQQVVVENVPGAGGMSGATRVAPAEPDGYQFLFGGESPNAQVQLMHTNPPSDGGRDFRPVALVAEQPLIITVRNGIPAATLHDFVAYARGQEAKMQFGSPGTGSGSHLACALFDVAVNIAVTHVPYRGLGPAMQDLLAGRIDCMCPSITTAGHGAARGSSHSGAGAARPQSLGVLARYSDRAGAGAQRHGRQQLECRVPAQSDTGADRRQAQRGADCRQGKPAGAAALAATGCESAHCGSARRSICRATLRASSTGGAPRSRPPRSRRIDQLF